MTIDLEETPLPNPERRLSPGRGMAFLRPALASAPERLLLAFLWFCFVAAAAYVSGFFHPMVVVPATLVVAVATWRLYPDTGPRDRRAAAGSALSLGIAGMWFMLNLPYVAERVQVDRDPDVYTLTALWLLDHTSPSIPVHDISSGVRGLSEAGGALRPQGNHLVAGVSASIGWVFGQEAVFWGNLACGAAALLAVYVLARRVVGSLWGLVPMLALAGSLPMLEFSRALYSEPLAILFTFLGTTLLWSAWKRDRASEYLVAGAAFGAVALTRIDGTLPLIGVLVGLTLAAFVQAEPKLSGRRRAALLVLLGSLPGVLLGFADLYFHSGPYLADLATELLLLLAGLIVAVCVALFGAFVTLPEHRRAGGRRLLSRAATAGAVLATLAFAVLLTRPWWYVSHGPRANSLVEAIQVVEGSPVDGTRLYGEQAFNWLSWYYGWPVVLVGLGGLLAWLVLGARLDTTRLLWLSALFLPSALLYLTEPNITPDQVWAMRRFMPVVVPGMLLAAVWVASRLASRRPIGPVLAAALVVSAVWWPLGSVTALWTEKSKAGALAGNRSVCEEIDGRPTIVTGIDTYLATVRILCDVPAVSVPRPTPERLAAAREALGSGSVVLATRDPGRVPWIKDEAPAPLQFEQRVWERSLDGPPQDTVVELMGVTVGLVEANGRVSPINGG